MAGDVTAGKERSQVAHSSAEDARMTNSRILVVDDDPGARQLLSHLLEDDGHDVVAVESGEEALRVADTFAPDLALLDGGLPGMDGRTVARRLRDRRDLGLIFVTGADSADDVYAGFDAGGDDYVVKPFDPELLLRRVRAVLRRLDQAPKVWEVGPLVLDEGARRVVVDGVDVRLSAIEFELLRVLVRFRGRVVTPEQLLDEVWNYRYDPHVVESTISRLRAKLESTGCPRFVHTVRAQGYVLRV
jgi:two-component system OmpR family response regulator